MTLRALGWPHDRPKKSSTRSVTAFFGNIPTRARALVSGSRQKTAHTAPAGCRTNWQAISQAKMEQLHAVAGGAGVRGQILIDVAGERCGEVRLRRQHHQAGGAERMRRLSCLKQNARHKGFGPRAARRQLVFFPVLSSPLSGERPGRPGIDQTYSSRANPSRRFCCQQDSVSSVQNCFSLP